MAANLLNSELLCLGHEASKKANQRPISADSAMASAEVLSYAQPIR